MIREGAPTRAEAARDKMPTGTRKVCERCGKRAEDARFSLCPSGRGHLIREYPLCSGCGGEGGSVRFTPGSVMPDPQTERLCGRCEGTGVEGLL